MHLRSLPFLLAVALTALGLLSATAAVNVHFDPSHIYSLSNEDEALRQFARRVLSGELLPDVGDQRSIKRAYSAVAPMPDCVALGSSRVLQVSTERPSLVTRSQCPTLMNLGVYGGALEDVVIQSQLLFERDAHPKIAVIGVDPWMLRLNADERWARWQDDYLRFLADAGLPVAQVPPSFLETRAKNLVNASYLLESLRSMVPPDGADPAAGGTNEPADDGPDEADGDDAASPKPLQGAELYASVLAIDPVDVTKKLPRRRAWLRDGSIIYGRRQMARAKEAPMKAWDVGYKVRGVQLEDGEGGKVMHAVIDRWRQRGTRVVLLMTPYHPTVFDGRFPDVVAQLELAERSFIAMAREDDVEIVGSFDPDKVGCPPEEFLDARHCLPACLTRFAVPQAKPNR